MQTCTLLLRISFLEFICAAMVQFLYRGVRGISTGTDRRLSNDDHADHIEFDVNIPPIVLSSLPLLFLVLVLPLPLRSLILPPPSLLPPQTALMMRPRLPYALSSSSFSASLCRSRSTACSSSKHGKLVSSSVLFHSLRSCFLIFRKQREHKGKVWEGVMTKVEM